VREKNTLVFSSNFLCQFSPLSSGDVLPCLTEWTKPDLLSAECVAKFPAKEQPKEKRNSKEDKKKADARRRSGH
jgi:hypothetical protein